VIRNQKHRAGRFQRVQVVSPEAEQDLEQKAEDSFHGFGKCIIWERALQTKFVPVYGEMSFALSGQFSAAFASIRANLISLFGKLAGLFFHSRLGKTRRKSELPCAGEILSPN
jgi:hypothetical protein